MRMSKSIAVVGTVLALAAVGACSSATKAPFDAGICYSVVPADSAEKGAETRFNVLARDVPQIETCAARLEQMRVQFLRLGGSNRDVIGAYQGQFIFLDRAGVWFGKTLEGTRYFALARTGDGRLAVPGAIERAPEAASDAPTVEMAPNP